MRLSEAEFEELVIAALDGLPEDLLAMMDNIEVTIERVPTHAHLRNAGVRRGTLLGLYEGIPLTVRQSTAYNLVAPDKITIFQRPIEQYCHSREEIIAQVRKTVVHEVAHHFGIGEARLRELGWG